MRQLIALIRQCLLKLLPTSNKEKVLRRIQDDKLIKVCFGLSCYHNWAAMTFSLKERITNKFTVKSNAIYIELGGHSISPRGNELAFYAVIMVENKACQLINGLQLPIGEEAQLFDTWLEEQVIKPLLDTSTVTLYVSCHSQERLIPITLQQYCNRLNFIHERNTVVKNTTVTKSYRYFDEFGKIGRHFNDKIFSFSKAKKIARLLDDLLYE